MRIAFITSEYVTEPSFSGGLANYLGRVSVALADRGHEVHVLTRSTENGQIDYRGVNLHRVVPLWDRRMILDHADPWVPRRFYNPYQDLKAAWCLNRRWKKLQRERKFDLVQVANVMAVGLFVKQKSVPVVLRMSSYRPEWDTAAGYTPTMGVKARWRMEARSIRGRQYLYAPSHYVAGRVEQAYRTPPVDVIESPLFREKFTNDNTAYEQHAAGQDYLLFFGRMTQMKGVHILARALPGLLARHRNMLAIFIGADAPAPDGGSMHEYLNHHAGEFRSRIKLLAPLRHDQLYPLLQRARVVALPSLIDNLPNTLLESMGHERVVVATTGSCFEQLIDDGKNGFLVPPGEPEPLAAAIEKAWLLTDVEREEMGRQAKLRVAELHPDKAIPQLIAYYEDVIARFKAGKPSKREKRQCQSAH